MKILITYKFKTQIIIKWMNINFNEYTDNFNMKTNMKKWINLWIQIWKI